MRTRHTILTSILLTCFCFNLVWAASETEKSAFSAAEVWLSLIDSGDYPGSWKEASSYFQGAVSEQRWAASLDAVRKPLGKMVSRKRVKTQESSSLPGAPDGRYVVISYETAFEQKESSIETITLTLDKDGKWRAAGYFIK
ncbi:MAG: hypothetical protein A4E72_00995 [Syntrophus sp. PtaU1.Bin208]|nr:MAG: hypothetical protein A4E72_00995 [Syntrophus sp. PtaU1.Bin208]